MRIRSVGAVLFHADRHMGRYDEANSRVSQFCERAVKRNNNNNNNNNYYYYYYYYYKVLCI